MTPSCSSISYFPSAQTRNSRNGPTATFPEDSIPAHAGKTPGMDTTSHCVSAHPRSRGENDVRDDDNRPFLGSSPLTRGKRSRPTRAGRGTSAHPRSRGENGAPGDEADVEKGSSPLTRGKPPPGQRRPHGRGLIPAHAGKTCRDPSRRPIHRAHPRSRGENLISSRRPAQLSGSSPLTRGKRGFCDLAGRVARLIPAHAGKTDNRAMDERAHAAHPRSRGENSASSRECTTWMGSSPLTRGKRRHAQ